MLLARHLSHSMLTQREISFCKTAIPGSIPGVASSRFEIKVTAGEAIYAFMLTRPMPILMPTGTPGLPLSDVSRGPHDNRGIRVEELRGLVWLIRRPTSTRRSSWRLRSTVATLAESSSSMVSGEQVSWPCRPKIRQEWLEPLGAQIVGGLPAHLQCGPEPRSVPLGPGDSLAQWQS